MHVPGLPRQDQGHGAERDTGGRRDLLLAALAGGGLAKALPTACARAEEYVSLAPQIAMAPPRAEFVYEAICELSPTMALGDGPLGERRMVPITGG